MKMHDYLNKREPILSNKDLPILKQNHWKGPTISLCIHVENNAIQSTAMQPSRTDQMEVIIQGTQLHKDVMEQIEVWVAAYTQKKACLPVLPFAWETVSLFTRQVLETLQTIPFGSVLSYGQVAALLNHPRAFRAIGGACSRNPFLLFIPCHRVLRANQQLGGFTAGLDLKKILLAYEQAA